MTPASLEIQFLESLRRLDTPALAEAFIHLLGQLDGRFKNTKTLARADLANRLRHSLAIAEMRMVAQQSRIIRDLLDAGARDETTRVRISRPRPRAASLSSPAEERSHHD